MRTESWNRLPIIRMTNISILPGAWRFEDLIADTDDAVLMDFAQEQSVRTVAAWLHRSEAAVRRRFCILGESARISDNYTQEELARDLRVSPKTVRRWEAAGHLERRDGRITHESLEYFCRHYPSEINFDTLDVEMQRWLRDCAGFAAAQGETTSRGSALKHLQKTGVCPYCGRNTRGNAHGRHIKACARKTNLSDGQPASIRYGHPISGHPLADSTTKPSAARRQLSNEG
jgi:hypothetical protein